MKLFHTVKDKNKYQWYEQTNEWLIKRYKEISMLRRDKNE